MDAGAVLFGLALLVVVVPYVAGPFRQKRSPGFSKVTRPEQDALGQRQTVLSALRDLDFDFRLGKVDPADYTSLRAGLLTQAASLMLEIEQGNVEIEALIQSRRQALAKNKTCQQCGAPLRPGDRFCSACGAAFPSACPSCSQPLSVEDHFCPSCGTQVKRSLQQIQ